MGPFELNNSKSTEDFGSVGGFSSGSGGGFTPGASATSGGFSPVDTRRIIDENIIAMKIYDFCRNQECLTREQLGMPRALEPIIIGGINVNEGDIIPVPLEASSVTMDKLRVSKVLIISKEPSSFKKGYWDIELKIVFKYRLLFREEDGCVIGEVRAYSNYNKRISLFGSDSAELFMATDMFSNGGDNMLGVEPFINIESKAMNLGAKINIRHHHSKEYRELHVTIGLFSIIKAFRIVDLSVQSRGFAIPQICEGGSSIDACDFFGSLSFPMDIFAPPQKPEYLAGVSGDIPPTHHGAVRSEEVTHRDIRDRR